MGGERERERERERWYELGGAWEGEDKCMNAKLIYQIVEEERYSFIHPFMNECKLVLQIDYEKIQNECIKLLFLLAYR